MSLTILPPTRHDAIVRSYNDDAHVTNAGDDHMDLDHDDGYGDDRSTTRITIPGDSITTDAQFMRGHGTYLRSSDDHPAGDATSGGVDVRSSLLGSVMRVNKLLSVVAVKSRFQPEIGDLVIGVVREVGLKKWRVDIAARQDATLQLASINLPGGVQRRKTGTDELQMRTFFQEGDLVLAEVQSYFHDGSVSLHTRSLKYGKLRNGQFVQIAAGNVVRAKQSAASLGKDVDLVIGNNGYCFVSMRSETSLSAAQSGGGGGGANTHNNTSQEASEAIYSNVNAHIPHATRDEIARVRNCLVVLDDAGVKIVVDVVAKALEASRIAADPAAVLELETSRKIVLQAAFG